MHGVSVYKIPLRHMCLKSEGVTAKHHISRYLYGLQLLHFVVRWHPFGEDSITIFLPSTSQYAL